MNTVAQTIPAVHPYSDADDPTDHAGRFTSTAAEARWWAENSPGNRDGFSVEGDDPTALELWTVSALDHFNDHLEPAADDPRLDDLAEQARWDDLMSRGFLPM